MLRIPPDLNHQKPKIKVCRNCKVDLLGRPIILCGDCWRIGAKGVAVGGFIAGVIIGLLKVVF